MKNARSVLSGAPFSAVLATLVIAFSLGCASETKQVKRAADERVAQQEPMNQPKQMMSKFHEMFTQAPGLTEKQRSQLREILVRTFVSAQKIKTDFTKTKGAMIEALVDPDMGPSDVEVYKNRLVELDRKRLDVMLGALDQSQRILGKNKETAEYYRQLFEKMQNEKSY